MEKLVLGNPFSLPVAPFDGEELKRVPVPAIPNVHRCDNRIESADGSARAPIYRHGRGMRLSNLLKTGEMALGIGVLVGRHERGTG